MDPSAGNPSIKGYWRHRAQKKTPSSMPSVDAITEEYDFEAESLLADHMRLLRMTDADDSQLSSEMEEIRSTPLFSAAVAKLGKSRSGMTFPQFGLLAGRKRIVPQTHGSTPPKLHDPRIFLNVNAPWSAFICGSQGSGKSHSLSCMLENCLLPNSILGLLPNPLTALVFHYDSFTSTAGGQVSEAAYLCSSGLPVKVLVSPTNLAAMTILYTNIRGLPPGISPPTVQPFFLSQRYLNAERLMTLMAAGSSDGPMPLYMQTVLQVLRDMAKESQSKPGIDYTLFKHRILSKDLSAAQLAPLSLRLDLLESFIETDTKSQKYKKYNKDWTHTPGHLTIVDLSCPFVDSDTACGLFDMCLGVFLEQDMKIGRLVVLDEAHKFMAQTSAPAQKLTDSLIAAIRLQRHLACRIIIATQEPTISPRLLDLCSITLVHRFSSPEWMRVLRGHLAAASLGIEREAEGAVGDGSDTSEEISEVKTRKGGRKEEREREGEEEGIFETIVRLPVGEALLFAPAAMLDIVSAPIPTPPSLPEAESESESSAESSEESGNQEEEGERQATPQKLGTSYLKIRIRDRVTLDGGRSKYTV